MVSPKKPRHRKQLAIDLTTSNSKSMRGSSFLKAGSGWHRKGPGSSPEEPRESMAAVILNQKTHRMGKRKPYMLLIPINPYLHASHSHQENQEGGGGDA